MLNYTFDHDAVFRELGLEASSPEVKASIIEGITTQLNQRMGARLGTSMSEEDLKTFSSLADKSDAEAQTWVSEHFPNYTTMCDEELAQLVSELKGHGDTAATLVRDNP